MERFYCQVLGFYVTDRLGEGNKEMVFLSKNIIKSSWAGAVDYQPDLI